MDRLSTFLSHLSIGSSQDALKEYIVYSDEVKDALLNNKPVVALESTIITHGMKYPDNLETAMQVEAIVRENGAVPATIAIIDGIIHVGLEQAQLQKLAELGQTVHKCSRRDIPVIIAKKTHGATTVASTSYIATLVGIKVFVTGGIGGVHRGVEDTMDISADLNELGSNPITIICAGVKSILDIPRTLEYLETQSVTVLSVGTTAFPAFFTPDSGYKAPFSVNTPEEGAQIMRANHIVQNKSGILFAVPVPKEQSADSHLIDNAIKQALKEMEEAKVSGKNATPFLLKRVAELTDGKSLASNIALVKNNAHFGSKLAVEYSKLQ